MRAYDHLFFDLDNTLWDFSANSRRAMLQTLEQNGILDRLPSFESYFQEYEQINKMLWNDYHSRKISKHALITERFSRSLQKFNINDPDWQEINNLYLHNMALQTVLFPGTTETLTALKSKGYQMHIITNGFREVQHAKLSNCGLNVFFHKVFISEDIRTTKPHREIFEHALKSTNAPKKKSVMIGDSWETDIEGALGFGIDQIMFLNDGQHALPENIEALRLSASAAAYLEIKNRTKTRFINRITDLNMIL